MEPLSGPVTRRGQMAVASAKPATGMNRCQGVR
jgi:hypothetical protein